MHVPLKIIRLLIICFLAAACQTPTSRDGRKDEGSRGDVFKLPDSMAVYSANKDSLLLDSSQLAHHSSLKIFVVIDVSCPSCVADIDQWRAIVPDFMKYQVPVLLICFSKNNFEYIQYLFENGQVKPFPFPLYLDISRQLHALNPFILEGIAHQAVLTDEKNVVLTTGSPLLDEETKNRYLKIISEHVKKK